jgi:hypothetical protein
MAMVHAEGIKIRIALAHVGLWTVLAIVMFPLLMVVSISFREGNFAVGSLLPERPTLEHWSLALGIAYTREDGLIVEPPFPVLTWLWNSVKLAIASAVLVVCLSTTGAYAFARMQFAGKATLLKSMLIAQMFPAVLALVALYMLFNQLGGYVSQLGLNSHGAVVLASLGGRDAAYLDNQRLFSKHRLYPGRGSHCRWCHNLASFPLDPAANECTGAGRGLRTVFCRHDHRVPGRVYSVDGYRQINLGSGRTPLSD